MGTLTLRCKVPESGNTIESYLQPVGKKRPPHGSDI